MAIWDVYLSFSKVFLCDATDFIIHRQFIILFFFISESDMSIGRAESFRDSLEHSMNPELQKVAVLLLLSDCDESQPSINETEWYQLKYDKRQQPLLHIMYLPTV